MVKPIKGDFVETNTCGRCRFFHAVITNKLPRQGQCRSGPPVAFFTEKGVGSMWPMVNGDDWCGQWGRHEEAVNAN